VNKRKLIFCRLVLKETKLVKSITPDGKLFQTFSIRCDRNCFCALLLYDGAVAVALLSVRPSVRPSVCHICGSRRKDSRYEQWSDYWSSCVHHPRTTYRNDLLPFALFVEMQQYF